MVRPPDDHLPSGDAAKLAAIELELAQGWARGPTGGEDALSSLASYLRLKTQAEIAALVSSKFTWWQLLCNPYGVWRFVLKRRKVARLGRPSVDDLVELSGLLSFAQLGYRLDMFSAARMREFVRTGLISERDAWRLAHSLGCRVKEGDLVPAPLSLPAAILGLATGIVLLATSVFFLAHLGMVLTLAGSRDVCYVLGCGAASFICGGTGIVVCTATWGRRDAAGVIQALQDGDYNRPVSGRRPLIARLLW